MLVLQKLGWHWCFKVDANCSLFECDFRKLCSVFVYELHFMFSAFECWEKTSEVIKTSRKRNHFNRNLSQKLKFVKPSSAYHIYLQNTKRGRDFKKLPLNIESALLLFHQLTKHIVALLNPDKLLDSIGRFRNTTGSKWNFTREIITTVSQNSHNYIKIVLKWISCEVGTLC